MILKITSADLRQFSQDFTRSSPYHPVSDYSKPTCMPASPPMHGHHTELPEMPQTWKTNVIHFMRALRTGKNLKTVGDLEVGSKMDCESIPEIEDTLDATTEQLGPCAISGPQNDMTDARIQKKREKNWIGPIMILLMATPLYIFVIMTIVEHI